MNRPRTWVLAVVVLAVIGVAAVRAVHDRRQDSASWSKATITAVGVSPDRDTIWAQVASYYSSSCFVAHPEVDRGADVWTVRVRVERVSEFCTMEMCIDSPDEPNGSTAPAGVGTLVVPNAPSAGGPGCKRYAVELEKPIPAGVAVVAG